MADDPLRGFSTCPDGHRCLNGSLCAENPYNEGTYYCDCDEAKINDAVSGLSCEHVATDYCTLEQTVSKKSFCTNHGTCKATVGLEEAHLGCNCPPEYDGAHCQYVKGTNVPNNWPGGGGGITQQNWGSNSSSSDKMKAGVTAVIVLICLGLVGAMAFVLYKKRRHSSSSGISSPEYALDADGEVLTRSVQAGLHNNGNGGMGSPEFELDADGDVLKESVQAGRHSNGEKSHQYEIELATRNGSGILPNSPDASNKEEMNVVSPASDGDNKDNDDDREENGGIV